MNRFLGLVWTLPWEIDASSEFWSPSIHFSYHHLFAFFGLLKTFFSLLFPVSFRPYVTSHKERVVSLSLSFFLSIHAALLRIWCMEVEVVGWILHTWSIYYTVQYHLLYYLNLRAHLDHVISATWCHVADKSKMSVTQSLAYFVYISIPSIGQIVKIILSFLIISPNLVWTI